MFSDRVSPFLAALVSPLTHSPGWAGNFPINWKEGD